MTEDRGLWEHARYSAPRREHGFCNDDNARGLVITARESTEEVSDLATIFLAFVIEARRPDGTFRNRRDASGSWTQSPGSDDSQGRAWWGLGAIVRRAPQDWMRAVAAAQFETASAFRSTHLRANAYAALGAAEAIDLTVDRSGPTFELLDRTSAFIAGAARSAIPWPEGTLTYDNARIPEALIAAGVALGDETRTRLGLRLLEWLIKHETNGDRFSFTPVGGQTASRSDAAFDQQPIEAWATADACYRAFSATGDPQWKDLAIEASRWMLGRNDSSAVMYDEATGGTFDGLTSVGVNRNQGAESTLAGLGTLQVAVNCQAEISHR